MSDNENSSETIEDVIKERDDLLQEVRELREGRNRAMYVLAHANMWKEDIAKLVKKVQRALNREDG